MSEDNTGKVIQTVTKSETAIINIVPSQFTQITDIFFSPIQFDSYYKIIANFRNLAFRNQLGEVLFNIKIQRSIDNITYIDIFDPLTSAEGQFRYALQLAGTLPNTLYNSYTLEYTDFPTLIEDYDGFVYYRFFVQAFDVEGFTNLYTDPINCFVEVKEIAL